MSLLSITLLPAELFCLASYPALHALEAILELFTLIPIGLMSTG